MTLNNHQVSYYITKRKNGVTLHISAVLHFALDAGLEKKKVKKR